MPYGARLNPMFMALHSRLEMHIEPVLKNPGAQNVLAG
jgi:hypothetical protein